MSSSHATSTSAERRLSKPRKLKDSCNECAASKVKCTREQPECTRCLSRGFACVYSTSRRRGKHKASPIVKRSPEWKNYHNLSSSIASSTTLPISIPHNHNTYPSANFLPTSYASENYGDTLSQCYSRDVTPFYDSDPCSSSVYNDTLLSTFSAYLPNDATDNALCNTNTSGTFFTAGHDYTIPQSWDCSVPLPNPTPLTPQDCKSLALQALLDKHTTPRPDCAAILFKPTCISLQSQAAAPPPPLQHLQDETAVLQIVDSILSCRCSASGEITLLLAQLLSGVLENLCAAARTEQANANSSCSSMDGVNDVGMLGLNVDIYGNATTTDVTQSLFRRVQRVGGLVERLCTCLNETRGRGGVRKSWEGVGVQVVRELKEGLKGATKEVLRGSLWCV